MARVHCSHEYEASELDEREINRIVEVMSISTRHWLKEVQGHPQECLIHNGGNCSHG